jgi:hypothetical protein
MKDNNTEMLKDFQEIFGVGKTFSTIEEARSTALSFGKKHNIAFVVTKSNKKRMTLTLACKHHGEYRAGKTAEVTEGKGTRKPYAKDTQRNGCPSLVNFRRSTSGGLVVHKNEPAHNHPLPENRTVYAMHRKQSTEVMKLIMDTLALSGPNPVDTVMNVRN